MTLSELKSRLDKSVNFLRSELAQIRTGRANPSLLEDLVVEAYESKMSLKELGSITLSDAHTIMITLWDKSLIPAVCKEIREGELKLNPVEAGTSLKVPIPPLTEERRKEMTKLVNQKVEECKQSMRNIRQEIMKEIDKQFDEKSIGEDEKFSQKEKVDDLVKENTEQAEQLGKEKSDEIMTV